MVETLQNLVFIFQVELETRNDVVNLPVGAPVFPGHAHAPGRFYFDNVVFQAAAQPDLDLDGAVPFSTPAPA